MTNCRLPWNNCEDCPFLYDDCDGDEEYWERCESAKKEEE